MTALAVFLFACGSSSVQGLADIGKPGRWVALTVLLGLSAWWATESRSRLAVDPFVAGAAVFAVLLAVVSTAWSVDPRVTFERAVTLGVLVLTALLIAHAVAGRPTDAERVLAGLLGGAVAVAFAGLLVLAVAHGDAVGLATTDTPARFKGMGQDPNTASLLFAVATPIPTWMAVTARSWTKRMAFGAGLALLAGSIVASGSHGALLVAAVGGAVVMFLAVGPPRLRAVAVGTVVVVAAIGVWIETLPQPSGVNPPRAASTFPVPAPKAGYEDVEVNTPLDGELGIPLPGQSTRRTLTTSSGRTQAWGGAIRQAEQRPVTGYGFGTESRVFIDRWSGFVGSVPEDSYIGIALQLGVAGLVAFAALFGTLGRAAVAAVCRDRQGIAAVGVGVLVAGLVAAVGQSYIYSVGDVATVTVWIAALLLASQERTSV